MNKYPLWRYLIICAMLILGVIYSLPNLYGEDPAVQLSSTAVQGVLPADIDKIKQALQTAGIRSIGDSGNKYTYLIRFSDTSDQLKAQDIISSLVRDRYSVALNLAPQTPAWLRRIGAAPMKLGLDLRGGIHFLMHVESDASLKTRIQSDMHAMLKRLREQRIRYSGYNTAPTALTLQFSDESQADAARSLFMQNYQGYQLKTAKSADGFTLSATLSQQTTQDLTQQAMSQNMTILRRRINQLGVAEPVVQQQGKDYISVDLPGVQDSANAKKVIGTVATIRMQLVDDKHNAFTAAQTGVIPYGSKLYKQKNGQPILLRTEAILKGTAIVNANAQLSSESGTPTVSLSISGPDVTYFNKMTGENIGRGMATIYVETKTDSRTVNGKVERTTHQVEKLVSVATINSALGNYFQITGLRSMQEAENLALFLRSGAYSTPLSIVSQQVIGPSMGKDNIMKGELSTIIGLALVIVFMLCYYRLFGLFANLALLVNVVFIFSILSVLHATLTLPGIAGIVLTIGMAVDANVLINERIREELRSGMSVQGSIHAGYARAFSTIVDANVTTLIVAVILFGIGSGPVQSFAVTLIIGLLTSMLSAIFFTRAVVNLVYGHRPVKHLSIGIRVD